MNKFILISLLVTATAFSQSNIDWQLTGPGRSDASACYYDEGTLYVGASGRVYSSNDLGDTWKMLNGFNIKAFSVISSIVVKNKKIFVGSKSGFYSTTDNGEHWKFDTSKTTGFQFIWDVVLFENDIYILNAAGKLFRSTDEGNSWYEISPETWGSGRVIAIDKENIYIGGQGNSGEPNFWISTNMGMDWIRTRDTLTGLKTENIISLSAKDGNIFAGTSDNGLFISRDNGATWKKSDDQLINWTPILHSKIIGDTIFAGCNDGLYFSTDNGVKWNFTSFTDYVVKIACGDDKLFLASKGIGISKGGIEDWELKKLAVSGSLIYSLTENKNKIYACTYQQGVFVSDDECNNWSNYDKISDNVSVWDLEFLDSSIYYSNPSPAIGNLYFSHNLGDTWNILSNSESFPNVNIYSITVDEIKKNIFVGNRYGIYFSTDFGESWKLFHEDLKLTFSKDIIIKDDNIYITDDTGIFMSSDYGKTWKKSSYNNGLPYVLRFISLTVCNENIIVGAVGDKKSFGIYLSKDFGESWNCVLDSSLFTTISDMKAIDNYVFAGTPKGLLFSSDCGENWTKEENYLNSLAVLNLLIKGKNIYVGTNEGVFKAKLSDFGITSVKDEITEKPDYLYTFPPYPNPTRELVKVLVYFDDKTDILNDEISVVDIYGNIVAPKEDLFINLQNNYSAIISWDTKGVTDGVYLILITHGSKKRAIKVMVSR